MSKTALAEPPDRDDHDIALWESQIWSARNSPFTSWQRVSFDEPADWCWGDNYWANGQSYRCGEKATTDIGLCDKHALEIKGE